MTKRPKVIRHQEIKLEDLLKEYYFPSMSRKTKTIGEVIIDFLKFRREICNEILNGRNCDIEYLQSCFFIEENFIDDLRKSPFVQYEYDVYREEQDLFLFKSFQHLLEPKTEIQINKNNKAKEVAFIVKMFEFYINNRVEVSLHPNKVKTAFLRDFLSWYKDYKGEILSDSRARDYIVESSVDFDLDNDLYESIVRSNKEIIKQFFERNNVEKFDCYYPEVTQAFYSFYSDLLSIINKKRENMGNKHKIYCI